MMNNQRCALFAEILRADDGDVRDGARVMGGWRAEDQAGRYRARHADWRDGAR